MVTVNRDDVESLDQFAAREGRRPEPPNGASREEWAKALFKGAFRPPWYAPINSREETATGRALHPRFVDLLDVVAWRDQARLSRQECQIIDLHFGWPDLTIQEVACRINAGRSTVYRVRHDLLEGFLRWYYEEPDYQLPWRVYTKTAPADGDLD